MQFYSSYRAVENGGAKGTLSSPYLVRMWEDKVLKKLRISTLFTQCKVQIFGLSTVQVEIHQTCSLMCSFC